MKNYSRNREKGALSSDDIPFLYFPTFLDIFLMAYQKKEIFYVHAE